MRILVPIDGSEHSLRAARYVADNLAHYPYSKVILLTVANYIDVSLVSESPVSAERFGRECLRRAEVNMEKAAEVFSGKCLVEEVILGGDPAEAIIRYVQEHNIDQIVMGSRGLSDFKGMVLGSVSHKVLARVDVPVTFIK